MESYQTDLSCAAATAVWALQMPSDLPRQQQDDVWAAAIFFPAHAQVSGGALGYSPAKIAGSVVAFEQWSLPEIRATNPAADSQKKAHLAAAVQRCEELPVFKDRPHVIEDVKPN